MTSIVNNFNIGNTGEHQSKNTNPVDVARCIWHKNNILN